jgi:type IX secretion system PorP/SprF family membrane protein
MIAQSNIRLSNHWGDMHFISPASIYDKYDGVFSLAAKKQWLGIDGSPTSFFASGTVYMEDYHTQLGLFLIQDKVGYTSTTNLNFSYAYALNFKYDWQLHLGLAGNYQLLAYDISKVSMSDGSDPVAYQGLMSKSAVDADIAAELTNKTLKMGVVTQNLISAFSAGIPIEHNTNYVYARYHQNSNNVVNFGAGVCGIQYADIYQLEFNATSYFKYKQNNGLTDKPDVFDVGMYYRTRSEAGLILGFNISEVLHVSYSYDYHFGSLSRSSYGTNELMITYNLKRKLVCRNCWY